MRRRLGILASLLVAACGTRQEDNPATQVATCNPACPPGTTCGATGECVAPGAPSGPLFGREAGLASVDGGSSCIHVTVGFERLTPTVIVLVDRSGSMTEDFGGGVSRWESLRRTLVDPGTGVLPKIQDEVRLGLTMYTSFDGNDGGVCPILVEVPPALHNFDAITAVYSATEIVHQEDDTPTAESVRAVTAKLLAVPDPGPKAIVLATDGEPDTCANANAHDATTNARSVAAVEEAFARGITTEILSVGSEVGQPHLQDLANAGVGGTGTPFRALDAAGLVTAFDQIVRGVVSCEFQLDGTVEPNLEARGSVTLDGAALAFDDPDGWDLPARDRVRLVGAACADAKASGKVLAIDFPCGAYQKTR